MDNNEMTGNPNQQNPSVLNSDQYPLSSMNWNNSNPFDNSITRLPIAGVPQPPIYPTIPMPGAIPDIPGQGQMMNFVRSSLGSQVQPTQVHPLLQPQSSFCFGSPKPRRGVVQFPFNITTNKNSGQREFRCKRKTDSPSLQPSKQHITEEKMAEYMSNLDINSESSSSIESESTRMRRLYMCQEMRKFKSDPILPQCLLNRIQQPCTALVLWQPPLKFIPSDDESDNNNAERLNSMPEDVEIDVDNEISPNNMDLDNC